MDHMLQAPADPRTTPRLSHMIWGGLGYLNLSNFFCHIKISPVITDQTLFSIYSSEYLVYLI